MVDPANTVLGDMLLEDMTPVVMVLPTSAVEETCLRNGLSFVQLLSPFCNFNNIDVPVRTASDQPYRLQKFKLRLFYANDIRRTTSEVAKERLKEVITIAGEEYLSDSELSSDPPPIDDLLARSESEILPSWFQLFNKELVRNLSFSDHEAFDHPVACLLVVSSKDEQPINRFIDLFNTDKLPPILNGGAMDPKILRHYLLVHDNQDGPPEKATKILSEMRSTFGSNDCQLLCINSSQDGIVEHQDNPWATYASPHMHLGCFLTKEDVDEVKDCMQNLSSKFIIPHMEQKIRVLNQQVSVTRKGFKNQIKNLWWRKGKEDTPDAPSGPMYTFNSTESQIRLLGDYAFMLRDYELALSNYRLISTDYKLDKAWKHYAGVQEMMGLSYFMLDQSRKEAEYCMENAFNAYLKIGSSGQQNATRCGIWWVEMLKTGRDQYKEAATVYFRICNEDPLHSAVMLEQASYCYLYCKPPMLHKYGFHLVLSGDRYKRCDQIKQAIRTYRSALSIFKGTTWSHIKDHVHFHIGQWYASLGMYDVAVAHLLKVLACSHQSKITQELFLREFLQIVQKTGKTFEVLKLQLPLINISSLKVYFEDHRTYASPEAVSVKESLWHPLEEDMIPSLPIGRTNWLELQSKFISKKLKESNVCVAGESVKLDIEFKNPLQIPISISSVSLMCSLSPKSDETESGSSSAQIQTTDEIREPSTSRDISSDISAFSLSETEFQLGGGETMVVQLMVTPRAEGTLKINGVRWKLSGSVVGFYNFESSLPKKTITKGRKAKNSPIDNLTFIVIKSLPKLQGVIHPLPQKVYAGDVRNLVLELKNVSDCSLKNLKMKISHPRFLSIGNLEDLNMEFPTCLEKKTSSEPSTLIYSKESQALFQFPEDTVMQGENPLVWPLWLRAAVPGNVSLYLIIYYEVGDTSSVMKYRTLRMHYNMQVLPSLDVSFRINPSPSRLEEFLVRMDIINRTISESFEVQQLSSLGAQWEISLFQSVASQFPSQSLMAGQALSYFFLLKKCRKPLSSDDKISSVRLSPQGSNKQTYNISCSPLVEFHNCERLHRETSPQDSSKTVDFILISRLNSNIKPAVSDQIRLFTHYACHCSIESTSPISWTVEGPRTINHDFSASFCEISLKMIVYNLSEVVVCVHINTYDSRSSDSQSADASAVSSGNQGGWHDLSLANDNKATLEVQGAKSEKSIPYESVSPFIWSGASSTKVQLEPMSTSEIPLQICLFSPGTYDLSNYVLNWNFLSSNDQGNQQSSGTCQGYPLYLTALPSE